MRKQGKVDANQALIIRDLRKMGFSVLVLSSIGQGCPDILVGSEYDFNTLLEIKDENQPPSKRKLTPDEAKWFRAWKGQVALVRNTEEALRAIRREVPVKTMRPIRDEEIPF